MKKHIFQDRIGPQLPKYYSRVMMLVIVCACLTVPACAISDLFAVAKEIIIDLYTQISDSHRCGPGHDHQHRHLQRPAELPDSV